MNEDKNNHCDSSQLTQSYPSCQTTSAQLSYESQDLIQGHGQDRQSFNTHLDNASAAIPDTAFSNLNNTNQ